MDYLNTLNCLAAAFAGESMARNRYTFYAKVARKEGYVYISKLFLETAENEKEHAETLMELIQGISGNIDFVKTEVELPIKLGNTVENLKAAIAGENFEHTKMYPEFAEVAEKEGYTEIAKKLRAIAKAEVHHEERFKKVLEAIENGIIFRRDEEVLWICLECGYVHYGKEPPETCPSCGHSRDYYVARDLVCL